MSQHKWPGQSWSEESAPVSEEGPAWEIAPPSGEDASGEAPSGGDAGGEGSGVVVEPQGAVVPVSAAGGVGTVTLGRSDWVVPPVCEGARVAATTGWAGWLNRLGFRLGESAQERADRENGYRIARRPSEMVRVLVAQPKGDAGKTTVSIGLGAVLVEKGGLATVVVDGNEGNATATFRAGVSSRTTAFDLCEAASLFIGREKGAPELRSYMADHQAGRFDLLAASTRLEQIETMTRERIAQLLDALAIGYQVAVIDCGNSLNAPGFRGALERADVVVVPVDLSTSTYHATGELLSQLRQAGREDLITGHRIVPVITGPVRNTNREFLAALERDLSPVFRIGFDQHIAEDAALRWSHFKPQTQHDFFELGAHVMTIATAEKGTL